MNGAKDYAILFLKGVGMGAANVIPGVSGGTIAFITGIYEKLIHSIKSFNLDAAKLLLSGKFKEFAEHVNLVFLITLFSGVAASIVSLAKVLEYVFVNYPTLTWAFFFGLIIASVYLVGKEISQWSISVIISIIVGTAIAAGIAFLTPATENAGFLYLVVCGVVAICSMILPGLSGSYILLIMGNYLLILKAVNGRDFGIILPVAIGAAVGLPAFSYFLSWVFKNFKEQTIGLLTGFIFGSLLIIWPWKNTLYLLGDDGQPVLKDGVEKIVTGYDWFFPAINGQFFLALGLIIAGAAMVVAIDILGANKPAK